MNCELVLASGTVSGNHVAIGVVVVLPFSACRSLSHSHEHPWARSCQKVRVLRRRITSCMAKHRAIRERGTSGTNGGCRCGSGLAELVRPLPHGLPGALVEKIAAATRRVVPLFPRAGLGRLFGALGLLPLQRRLPYLPLRRLLLLLLLLLLRQLRLRQLRLRLLWLLQKLL